MIETGKLAALGRLAGGVAHEINNPVNIMMQKAQWSQELLEDFDFSQSDDTLPEVRSELEAIVRQARRCRDIVSKLMSLGGRVDPRASEFCPRDAVRGVLEGASGRASELGVAFRTRFDEDTPMVLLPLAEIEQVLRHLVDNALDAMSPGGGTLTMSVAIAPEGTVRIELADTGHGVDPAIEERLFEPFFSTKDVGQGSGLGLSICHGILKSLGGDVAFVRPDGPGAIFAVTLPQMPSRG